MTDQATPRRPAVSVVIPSIGRDLLLQAVASALAQTYPPLEVIVVYDLPAVPDGIKLADGVRTKVTGGQRGPNATRQTGIDMARGDAIALLDDDDFWYPGKLAAQVELLTQIRDRGKLGIVTAGTDVVDHDGKLCYGPGRFIRADQSIPDYLFRRRQFRGGGGNSFGPSSLLVDRTLFREEPLDPVLRIHEDWDWLLRATARPEVAYESVHAPLLAYRLPARGARIKSSIYWRMSVDWADQRRSLLSRREYADFLLSVSTGLAVEAGSRLGAAGVIARAVRRGRPGPHSLVVGLGFLCMPRQSQTRIWSLIGEARTALRFPRSAAATHHE